MSRIVDLDVIAPITDLTVLIGDTPYLIPGDIPVEDYAALVEAAEALDQADGEHAIEAAMRMNGLLLDLFRQRQPDLEKLPVGLKRLVPLVFVLFNDNLDTGDPEGDPPRAEEATDSTTTKSAGSASSPAKTRPRKRTTRSRSSSSSAS